MRRPSPITTPWVLVLSLTICVWPTELIATQVPKLLDPYSGRPIELKKEVEIRATVGGDFLLTDPRALLTHTDHIYVLDPPVFGIHQLDRLGRWLKTIGKRGEGPGEFLGPAVMGWVADTLWVADPALGRLSLLDPSGGFLRSVRFNSILEEEVRVPGRALMGSRIVSIPYLFATTAGRVDSLPILLVADDGAVQDTLAWEPFGQKTVSVTIRGGDTVGEAIAFFRHDLDVRGFLAWGNQSKWLYSATWRDAADGVAELELLKISATKDTMAAIRLPLARRSLSRQEIRSRAREYYAALSEEERAGVSRADLARAFMQQVANPTEGIVDRMTAADDGTVWLRRSETLRDDGTGEHWAAYRFAENFLGFARLPVGHSLIAATGGLLWTRSVNEIGLSTIVGWALTYR